MRLYWTFAPLLPYALLSKGVNHYDGFDFTSGKLFETILKLYHVSMSRDNLLYEEKMSCIEFATRVHWSAVGAHGFARLGRGRKLKALRSGSGDKAPQYPNISLTVHYT